MIHTSRCSSSSCRPPRVTEAHDTQYCSRLYRRALDHLSRHSRNAVVKGTGLRQRSALLEAGVCMKMFCYSLDLAVASRSKNAGSESQHFRQCNTVTIPVLKYFRKHSPSRQQFRTNQNQEQMESKRVSCVVISGK